MNELVMASNGNEVAAQLSAIAHELLRARANPESLTLEEAAVIGNLAKILDQANRRIKEADQMELSSRYTDWKALFLDGFKSKATRRSYEKAIARLEAFCEAERIEPTELRHEGAKRFAQSSFCRCKEEGAGERAAESIRLTLTAVSSLYSEMARLSEGAVYNPFLRMKAKPRASRTKDKAVPTAEELEAILANTTGEVRAAVACMSYRGFRIGALPSLVLTTRDGKTTFRTVTKGKEQWGELPNAAMDAIEAAGLSRKKPFEGAKETTLAKRVERELDRLAAQGLITGHKAERKINRKAQAVTVSDYSCHSFRHFYAVAEYNKDKDIERVRRLLNHSTLTITQTYLQSLGCIEE